MRDSDDFYDLEHPDFLKFMAKVEGAAKGAAEKIEQTEHGKLISLFYAVRDEIRYNPYRVGLEKEDFKASKIAVKKANYCIPKAILFTAGARYLGYEAKLGLADVKNHLASERFIELLGSDLFAFHGYSEVIVDGKALKVTPTFDRLLCEKYGVATLEFDATTDTLFQPFDLKGEKFMEYITDRGTFESVPYNYIINGFQSFYPDFANRMRKGKIDGDLMLEK